ncbi:hypothetical protein PAECIP111802_06996 [Paenibacillus allorhizosphaerae]|uniref:Nucleotidyl transferase AbiEii/AbiGii toxin family protein n=2 Tax=Paenibacillus allorhizosphaerae TaxID=2849866 RepID=A0ABM8VTV9_9BACL|nr:hypothetical protein [Paenibacillus allorhizosphaerae]CAG7658255.1 hypothetical protein PAECIP111802_06996 [Paenibacillus allorhizosphaerae]
MIIPELILVLELIYERLSMTQINWALTGSTSFALQGLPYEPGDIDIQTDQQGAYEIESLFKDYLRRNVGFSSNGSIRSHFGELLINGISVEIIGDIEKLVGEDDWQQAPNLNEIKQFINVVNMNIPVLSLEYEAQAYRDLGREDKAATLFNHLRNL